MSSLGYNHTPEAKSRIGEASRGKKCPANCGFKLSWCPYTPDFYLPEFDIWVEVKGHPKQVGNWAKKMDDFRAETGKTLILVFQKELSSRKYGGE